MANDDKRKGDEQVPDDERGLTVWERDFKRLHPQTWQQMTEEKRREQEGRS